MPITIDTLRHLTPNDQIHFTSGKNLDWLVSGDGIVISAPSCLSREVLVKLSSENLTTGPKSADIFAQLQKHGQDPHIIYANRDQLDLRK